MIAGAESLLMSLWQVEDEGTAEIMALYYKNILEGMERSEAMRQIQLEMITSENVGERHPSRWGAFILTGNWRPIEGSRTR